MSDKKPRVQNYALFVLLLFLAGPPVLGAQESPKKITYDQAYQNGKPRLFKPLASIRGWLDDVHYLLLERNEETNRSTDLDSYIWLYDNSLSLYVHDVS